jgi:hypothetical protein
MTALLIKNSVNIKRNISDNGEFKKFENYNYSKANDNKASSFNTNYYYLTFYLITILLLQYFSISSLNLKPLSPSSKLVNKGEFNANRAQVHLDTIASLPHGFNNLNNSRIFEYLLDQVKILGRQGEDRLEYVVDDDKELSIPQHQVGLNNWLGSFATYYPTSNLVVKVKGENSSGKALLLSAHYDSRPLSNGATDAGVGVAVSLEILRILLEKPQKGFDVIVNFNNAEETFLLGARSFAMNKWYQNAHYFINLEGSGAGGKPLLFQSTSLPLTQALTSGHSHVNPIGNDLFNLRLLPSATDYQIYQKDLKLKGVDLAMYRNRALYHTLRDNVEFAPLETTSYMGEMVLGGIRNLKGVEKCAEKGDKLIYFDLLNFKSIAIPFNSIYALIGLFYCIQIFFLALYYLKFNNFAILTTNLRSISNSSLRTLFGFLLNLITGALLISVIIRVNPMVVHSYPILILIIFGGASIWSQLAIQCILPSTKSINNSSEELNSWLGVLAFYNVLVSIQLLSHFIWNFVSPFFLVIQAYTILISLLTYLYQNKFLIYPKSPKIHPSSYKLKSNLVYYITTTVTLIPSNVVLMGLGLPLLLAIHQGPPTGASPYLPYLICLLTTSLTFLPSGPTLLPLRNIKKLSIILGALILSIYLISILTLFPYTKWAPLPIDFDQIIELNNNESFEIKNTFIKLRVSSQTDRIIKEVGLKPTEVIRGVKGGRSTFNVIRTNTRLPKELPDYGEAKYGMKVINFTAVETPSKKEVTLNFNTPESKICYLQFLTPVDHMSVSHLTQEFKSMTDPRSTTSLTSAIRLFRNNPELPWKLKFVSKTEELKISTKCYLERWDQVKELESKLPNWLTLTNQNLGIIEIRKEFNLKFN